MPTTQPRYSVTDTGRTAALIDLAHRAWPEVGDRKQLLLRLAEAGAVAVERELGELASNQELRRAALVRSRTMLDADTLLADLAWG